MAAAPKTPTKPEVDDAWGLVHVLKKSIKSMGEDVLELKFREPNGADISFVGVPVILDAANDPPRVLHDGEKMSAMIARLSGHSPQAIGQLTSSDWMSCAWLLTPFFMPEPGTI